MDLREIVKSLADLWESKPSMVLLLSVGFLVFAFLVVDTWRQKRRRRAKRPVGQR